MLSPLDIALDSGWIYSVFAFVAVSCTVVTIIIILSENRNPVKSLAWVTVLLSLPVAGLIIYLFFGRNIKNTRMISRHNRRKLRRREPRNYSDPRDYGLSEHSLQQIAMGRTLTGAQFYADNNIEVFTDGRTKFDRLIEDIRRARHSINIQYYIYEDDKLGNDLAQELIAKVKEGVKVRLIYDHIGSFNVKSKFFKRLNEAGVEASPFFKVIFPTFASRINWRNHRKVCVIDGNIGYIGGMNVADRYIDGGKKFASWRDTHVRVQGPAVSALNFSYAIDWAFMSGKLIEEEIPPVPELPSKTVFRNVGAQVITSGPTSQWPNIALVLHKAIANARQRVYIQTPYFLPTEDLLKALQSAALAHIDVRIMLPVKSDSRILTRASASYITECLKAGMKFYFYQAGMLHSKMILIDDELVSIGSTNFDFRSFECNFEANIFLYSRELNEKMLEVFKADQKQSCRVNAAEWRRRPFIKKTEESIFRLLSPVL